MKTKVIPNTIEAGMLVAWLHDEELHHFIVPIVGFAYDEYEDGQNTLVSCAEPMAMNGIGNIIGNYSDSTYAIIYNGRFYLKGHNRSYGTTDMALAQLSATLNKCSINDLDSETKMPKETK